MCRCKVCVNAFFFPIKVFALGRDNTMHRRSIRNACPDDTSLAWNRSRSIKRQQRVFIGLGNDQKWCSNFNVNIRRVENQRRGIYISHGKKVIDENPCACEEDNALAVPEREKTKIRVQIFQFSSRTIIPYWFVWLFRLWELITHNCRNTWWHCMLYLDKTPRHRYKKHAARVSILYTLRNIQNWK